MSRDQTDAERIARLERMVFLMLAIMNGTIFTEGKAIAAFGDHLGELWRLQRASEGIDEEAWQGREPHG